MTMQRQYRGEGLQNPEPQSASVPHGSGGPYSKKYVRVPVDVLKHTIIPAASDAAAQTLVARSIPPGQRFQVYHQLLREYINRGIQIYRQTNDLTSVTPQGILQGTSQDGRGHM